MMIENFIIQNLQNNVAQSREILRRDGTKTKKRICINLINRPLHYSLYSNSGVGGTITPYFILIKPFIKKFQIN